ncbi:MAG: hypothetical protein ACQRW7_07880 [Caulobacterales bacterium]|uniref:hypothetical protein n=1 Tax=Glycocaulis sp. TaxID=1969725 RepID=UPI003FA041B1
MPIGTGVLLALLFSLLLESWIAGLAVGVLFALGFSGVLVMTANADPRKPRRRRR